MAIQFGPRFRTKNDEIVAGLRNSAGAGPPMDPLIVVKRKTAEVAAMMALIHGGDWRVEIDHEIGFALISRRSQVS